MVYGVTWRQKKREWWDCRIVKKEASSYSMDTDESYCSTVLSRNERKIWDYVCRQLISHLKNNMTNPFGCSFLDHNVLINISTGNAIEEIQSSLLNAVKNGKDQMEAFVTRIFSESKRESLYIPISRSRVKIFGNMAKGTKIKFKTKLSVE